MFPLIASSQVELPEGFAVEWHSEDWDFPVDIDFDIDGRMFVTEKVGKVWKVENGIKSQEPLLDITTEVGSWADQGLFSLALDPDFEINGFIYLYYIVDRHHLLNSFKPTFDPNLDAFYNATIGRVSRFQVDVENGYETIVPASRFVLIGDSIDNGVPSVYTSHMGGTVVFGEDGTLLISTGDGSAWIGPYGGNGPPYFDEYVGAAMRDGIIREEEEVGGFRAQLLNNHNGKILRIDPQTGQGIPSNPYFDNQNPSSPQSRVYASGLRNVFRMNIRDGSGSKDPSDGRPGVIYAMDVGAAHWEELNIIKTAGGNYGWPLYEGLDTMPQFYSYDTKNLDIINPDCDNGLYSFKELLQEPILKYPLNEFFDECGNRIAKQNRSIMEIPAMAFAHGPAGGGFWAPVFDGDGQLGRIEIDQPNSPITGDNDKYGQCGIVGGFYRGQTFPEQYQDKLFIADYSQSWIKYINTDLNDEVVSIHDFFQDTINIAHVEMHPTDGSIYFIDYPNGIKRISFEENVRPKAIARSDIDFGTSPLTVQFYAEESYDPNGDSLNYEWQFGNGQTSNLSNPESTFSATDLESIDVTLIVTDNAGLTDTSHLLISINNTPPLVNITSINNGDLYSINGVSYLDLKAKVNDAEHPQIDLNYQWDIILGHNNHQHTELTMSTAEADARLVPAGCGDDDYYYDIVLTVTDPLGLSGTDTKRILPDCASSFVELFDFTATPDERQVELEWIVTTENQMDRYVIEVKSMTDKFFRNMGEVSANNLKDQVQKYNFIDQVPTPGRSVYRIRMIPNQGALAYSKERLIEMEAKNSLHLFPNPATSTIVALFQENAASRSFELYSMSGQLVLRKAWDQQSLFYQEIDIDELPSGLYIYRMGNGEEEKSGKLLIH